MKNFMKTIFTFENVNVIRELIKLWKKFFILKLIQELFAKFFDLLQILWHSMQRLKSSTFELVQHDIFWEQVSSFCVYVYFCCLIASTAIASRSHVNRSCKWEDYIMHQFILCLAEKGLFNERKKKKNYATRKTHNFQFLFILAERECILGTFLIWLSCIYVDSNVYFWQMH